MKKSLVLIVATSLMFTACNKSPKNLDNTKVETKEVEEVDEYMSREFIEKNFKEEEIKAMPQLGEMKKGEELAVLHTNMGDIKIRLFPTIAPKTVENFTTHIKNGYYNGIIFHRVIKDFMIQGGDPTGTGMGGESIWGEGFENETSNDLIHIKGALSMANTGQPNSNGSQFFIVQNGKIDDNLMAQITAAADAGSIPKAWEKMFSVYGGTPHLEGRHTVFGQVVEGIEVVDKIANVKTGAQDKPEKDVVIESAEMVKYE